VATRRRTIGIGIGVALGVLLLCGGPIALFYFGGPLDRVPAPEEMPQASEVPVPTGLELDDGRCTGGNAGCFKGMQVFELRPVGTTGHRSVHCAEFDQHLEDQGWVRAEVVMAGDDYLLNPSGGVAAKCKNYNVQGRDVERCHGCLARTDRVPTLQAGPMMSFVAGRTTPAPLPLSCYRL